MAGEERKESSEGRNREVWQEGLEERTCRSWDRGANRKRGARCCRASKGKAGLFVACSTSHDVLPINHGAPRRRRCNKNPEMEPCVTWGVIWQPAVAAAQINWTGREGEQPTASEKTDHPPNERVAAAEAGLPRLHTHPHTHTLAQRGTACWNLHYQRAFCSC